MVKRTYECMVLLDNREVRQGWQQVKDTVTGLFTKHGAEIVSARLWDERRLAYPIKQQRRGTYLLVYFDAETDALVPLSRELEFSEAVLRHLVLSCEEVPAEAHEPEREFDVTSIKDDDAAEEPEAEAAEKPEAPEKSEKPDEPEQSDEPDEAGEAEGAGSAEPSETPESPQGDAKAENAAPEGSSEKPAEPATSDEDTSKQGDQG